jgi:hypothetical protein
VKDGVDFNAQFVGDRFGVVLAGVQPRKQIGLASHETLFLSDFSEALERSTRLARAAVDYVISDWPSDRRGAVER